MSSQPSSGEAYTPYLHGPEQGIGEIDQSELFKLLRSEFPPAELSGVDRGGQHHPAQSHSTASSSNNHVKTDAPRNFRTPSPANNSIPIPPVLYDLADSTLSDEISSAINMSLPPLPVAVDEYTVIRGEMGGRRRKQPHERAGWKDMEDEIEARPRRRTAAAKRKIGEVDTGDEGGGDGAGYPGPGLVGESSQNATRSSQQGIVAAPGDVARSAGEGQIDPVLAQPVFRHTNAQQNLAPPSSAADTQPQDTDTDIQLSRAEQNKRAQQLFRRRREVHMLKLEADSAALTQTHQALLERDARLRDLAVHLEASKIENAALRSALRTVSQSAGTSILTHTNNLIIAEGSQQRPTPDTPQDLEAAFFVLEKQSREVAKQNRYKRDAAF